MDSFLGEMSLAKGVAQFTAAGVTLLAAGAVSVILYKRFRTLPQAQASDKQVLADLIQKNKVLVLSKTYCPYCKATKELLSTLKAEHTVIELDTREDGDRIQGAV